MNIAHARRHLGQMEDCYRALLEAAPDAIVVVNQAAFMVLSNLQAEKQFGYCHGELQGKRVRQIIPQGFAERLSAELHSGLGLELTGRRKDGSEFPLELTLSRLGSGEELLVIAAIRDISVRQQAEELLRQKLRELERSNEELAQFACVAAHDLQEPLRMVASYTALLSRRYQGKLDSDADDFIAFAVDGASRMQRLIQDLLAYSRVGSADNAPLATRSELALKRTLDILRDAIDASGAVVTHEPLPVVMADETQLIQLFQNLVGNAIKYHRAEVPRVHITAQRDGGSRDGGSRKGGSRWLFSVRDNGLGIDSQHFERIFGMFQRLHNRAQFDGNGVGLAICKKIVERHGGTLRVESQPGQGSTFSFSLAGVDSPLDIATGAH